MNSRFVLALAISAAIALLVTGIFYQVALSGRSGNQDVVASQEIVIAVEDLEIGAIVDATSLRLEPWPIDRIPEGSFTDVNEVVERVPINRILAREAVLGRRLAAVGSGVGLSPKVPDGMRALSVRVDDLNSLSGFVMPEARVDVLLTGKPSASSDAKMTRTILSNIRVLSAGENLEPDSSGKPQRVAVVTILVTPEQGEMLTLATSHGRIQLVLRNSGDETVVATSGVRENELFGEVAAPAPVRRAPRSAPVMPARPAPPPPRREIEVIRGNQRSVATFAATAGG